MAQKNSGSKLFEGECAKGALVVQKQLQTAQLLTNWQTLSPTHRSFRIDLSGRRVVRILHFISKYKLAATCPKCLQLSFILSSLAFLSIHTGFRNFSTHLVSQPQIGVPVIEEILGELVFVGFDQKFTAALKHFLFFSSGDNLLIL